MEFITNFIHATSDQYFSIPIWQIVIIVLLSIWCLFSGRFKSGLILSYFSICYWGLVVNRPFWVDFFGGQILGLTAYVLTVATLFLLGLLSYFQESY